jgi:PAS domain S-box-containing protein
VDKNLRGPELEQVVAPRKLAPLAIARGSEEQLCLFVEQAPVAIAMFDRDMRYLAASDRWLSHHGLTGTRVTGHSHYEISPEILERWKRAHKRGLAGETLREERDLYVRSDGRKLWLKWELRPWHDTAGLIGGIIIVLEDITATVEAEIALRERQEELDRAQSVARTGSWRLDASRNELRWSPETYRIFGVPQGTAIGFNSFLDALHPDDLEAFQNSWKAALQGRPYDVEHRIVVNGRVKWVRKRGELEFGPGGAVLSGFGTVQDITDRKEADQKLRESEELFRLATNAAGIGSLTIDVPARTVTFSAQLDFMVMASEQRTVTLRDAFSRVHRDDQARVRAEFESAVGGARDGRIKVDLRFVLPGGETRWITWAARVDFRDSENGPVPYRIPGACVDITERMKAGEAVRQSEERYRGIFENAATGIAIMDLEGRFQSCNPAYSSMLGYSSDELRKLVCEDLIHLDDRAASNANRERLLRGEMTSYEIVSRYFRKNRAVIWGHRHVSLLRDETGAPCNILALVTDITERKLHEEQISFLMREVNHRSKNLLSVVLAIARQTASIRPDSFLEQFEDRIRALSASQDLLVRNEWKGVDLHDLVRSQLGHFKNVIGTRINMEGPKLLLSAAAAQAIGIALHELATNAGEYGALSNDCGFVDLVWSLQSSDSGVRFLIEWRESGGPFVKTPDHEGFGSTVLTRVARESLDAGVELTFEPGGLVWRLSCPAAEISETFRLPG